VTAAIAKTSALTDPRLTWASLFLPGLSLGLYYIMNKYGGMKKMEEMLKEMEEVRACRDEAIDTAAQAFKLVERLMASEKLLREKLRAAESALKKERDENMEKFHKDFDARQNLEKANEDWKHKNADLEVRVQTLEKENARLENAIQQARSISVDGWWAPTKNGKHILKGVLVDFIDKDSSDTLQCNMLVFRLTEACDGCKDGSSTDGLALASAEDDDKLHRASAGSLIGVPEWKQLVGLWPTKVGHLVHIERSESRDLGKGRRMYSIAVQVSKGPFNRFKGEDDDAVYAKSNTKKRKKVGLSRSAGTA